MKKSVLLIVAFLSMLSMSMLAQKQHPFEVKRLTYWAPEYLTWTCSYYYHAKPFMDMNDITDQFKMLKDLKTEGYLWINEEKSTNIPRISCVIRSIDGVSTKGMSEDQFYDIIAMSDTHELIYVSCDHKEGKEELHSIITLQDTPFWVTQLGFVPFSKDAHFDTTERRRKANVSGDFRQIFDDEIDWSQYHTYDYALRGTDPLNDKKLLQYIADSFTPFLRRDTNAPDLFFTITTNTDQSISTTYVPPVVQTIRSGATTETRYNWITKKNEYVTRDNYKTIREDGYTQTNKMVKEFLEFAILDGKKVRENKSDVPPIVFQVTYKRDALNPGYNTMDEYKAVSSWIEHPIYQRFVTSNYICGSGLSLNGMYLGKYYDKDKGLTVFSVISGSEADKAGIKAGEYISKYKVVDGKFEITILKDRYSSKKNKRIVMLPTHGKRLYDSRTTMTLSMTRLNCE